MSNFFSFFFKL